MRDSIALFGIAAITLGMAPGPAIAAEKDASESFRAAGDCPTAGPAEVGSLSTPQASLAVAVVGGFAYVADYGPALRVIDVSAPSTPVEVGSLNTPSSGSASPLDLHEVFYTFYATTTGVAVVSNYAYVADGDGGLHVIDVSTPSAPVEVGLLDTPGWRTKDITVTGNYAYVTRHKWSAGFNSPQSNLTVLDITDPSAPVEVGSLNRTRVNPPLDVAVAGNYAYVADGYDGLRVIDVTDPSTPVEVGYWDRNPTSSYLYTDDLVREVAVAGNYAYVALSNSIADSSYVLVNNGLHVIDISTPSAPVEVGSLKTPGRPSGVAVEGNYAYLADGYAGLRVIDVSTPSAPVEVDWLNTPGYARGVTVAGGYAYVADFDAGLRIIELESCDDDLDGVPNATEQAGPNGGDGNGDGIPDDEQAEVASIPDLGGSDYVTLEAVSGCGSVSNVTVSAEATGAGADPNYDHGYGLVGFSLPCPGPVNVKLYFHATSGLTPPYRKYGPTTPGDSNTLAWYDLPGAAFATETVGTNLVSAVTFTLSDGVLGDATGVDGEVVDPGGPGGGPPDTDGDGVPDAEDNCLTRGNGPYPFYGSQVDYDSDGYGSACDSDFNNDGAVGLDDVFLLLLGLGIPGMGDLNGDGAVGLDDMGLLLMKWNTPVGPSGLACAGSGMPCPAR